MELEPFENPWMKKIKMLTKILLVSVTVNIGLFTTLLHTKLSKPPEDKKAKALLLEDSNGEVLSSYFKKSFSELVRELKDKTLLQDGYTKRDLALACLVNYHYLNLDKAISGKLLQKRKLTFIHTEGGEGFHVEVFPQLDDLDFALVEKFVKEEAWPLSAEGLFLELKKGEKDPSLESAFARTPEFTLLHMGLRRLDETISRDRVLQLLLIGDWDSVREWMDHVKRGGDGLSGMREFFQAHLSKETVALWIALDSEYLQRKLPDLELHKLVQYIGENSLAVNIFLKQIICSVRSDEVRREAALKLYAFAGVEPPEPYNHEVALQTFLPSMFVKKEVAIQPVAYTPVAKKHKVEDGESLWKIAKKHKVTIEALREANKLKSDSLKPGQELVIP